MRGTGPWKHSGRVKTVSYFVASLSTALLNTVFFVLSIIVFFWKNETFLSEMNTWGLSTDSLWVFIVAFVGINGVIEAVVNTIIGGATSKSVEKIVKSGYRKKSE